jgi:undecaprenyl-diphosphatase
VQGITEFLPISSDGHLVVVSRLLKTPGDELTLVVLLHLGSLAAILLTFRHEIAALFVQMWAQLTGRKRDGKPALFGLLVLATLPVVVIGLLLHSLFIGAFESVGLTGAMLILTGLVLLLTRAFPEGNRAPNARSALAMGFAQVFALLPGLSRSALTLSTGFALGGDRRQVARFSFLMAIPAIAGANILEMAHASTLGSVDPVGVTIGAITAFVASMAAIRLVLRLVRRGRFEWFGAYCVALGILVLSLG